MLGCAIQLNMIIGAFVVKFISSAVLE